MTDDERDYAARLAIHHLAGLQVVGLAEAFDACTGLSLDEVEREQVAEFKQFLMDLGYEQLWVLQLGRSKMAHLWCRESWPIDYRANLQRDVKAYYLMC